MGGVFGIGSEPEGGEVADIGADIDEETSGFGGDGREPFTECQLVEARVDDLAMEEVCFQEVGKGGGGEGQGGGLVRGNAEKGREKAGESEEQGEPEVIGVDPTKFHEICIGR